MKKKIFAIALCAVLLIGLLSGCDGGDKPAGGNESSYEAAELITMFLSGEKPVKITQDFIDNDPEYYREELVSGDYNIEELRELVNEINMTSSTIVYSFFDLGNDGKTDLLIEFMGDNPTYMNYTFAIVADEETGDLYMTDALQHGYRAYADYYNDGTVIYMGSYGAGAFGYEKYTFNAAGERVLDFALDDFTGTFADSIAYYLDPNFTAFETDYSDLDSEEVAISSCLMPDGNFYIAVYSWASDPATKALQEQYIQEFVDRGAILVETAELDEMSDLSAYFSEDSNYVEWADYDPFVYIRYADEVLAEYDIPYTEFMGDSSEYSVNLIFMPTLPIDIKLLRVEATENFDDNGVPIYKLIDEISDTISVTGDEALVMAVTFEGDMPTKAVAYTDEHGCEYVKIIGPSGEDGELYTMSVVLE